MFKNIFLVSFIAVLLSVFFGEQARELIVTLISTVIFKSHEVKNQQDKILFTADELKLYNGIDKPELYLAILGNVFDVTRGIKHYGPNQQYNVFVGCDASRNFVTGKFNKEDVSDEVTDLSPQELQSISHWLEFYTKDYRKVGKLIGRYYDESGKATPYAKQVRKLIKAAEISKVNDELEKRKFPPCNVEWDLERGTKVWCTNKSGGIDRDWTGVPRQLYEAGSKSYRCACIKDPDTSIGNIKEYENCDKSSDSCYVKQEL